MNENNKLVNIILTFYAMVKLNILTVCTLLLGLFFITFQPSLKASMYIISLIKEKKIDGYTKIRQYYFPVFKKEIFKVKRNIPCSLAIIWTFSLMLILRRMNSPISAVINIFLMYFIMMIIMFSMYWQALNVKLEKEEYAEAQAIEGVVYMFYDIKNFLISNAILLLSSYLIYRCPILITVIMLSLYEYIFYSINMYKKVELWKMLIKRRKND